jgi:Inner membrane protein YgaP-like, transmembrane domain
MKQVVSFLNSLMGRSVRAALGVALVVVGLAAIHGSAGAALAIIGLVPLAMGAWGRCLIEPFAGHRLA